MAFCPNPDCSYRKEIGRAAEFRQGITHCSDCGSLLSEETIEKEDIRKTRSRIRPTDLHKRVLYTIGFVLLWRVLMVIPVPGINLQALQELFGTRGLFEGLLFGYWSAEKLSVVALGIMPYLSAYMIVEILSLFVQPLKSWRGEGYPGRIKIKEVALFVTILFAFVHGYGLAQGLERMLGASGEKMVTNPGLSFRLISALALTAGTFLTIWITELITRKGIGHGVSVLIFVGYGPRIFSNLPQIKSVPRESSPSPLAYFLLLAIMVVVLIALIVLMERGFKRISVKFNDGTEAYIPLKITTAGIIPTEWTYTLIMLPSTLLFFLSKAFYERLSESLVPTGAWYFIVYSLITICLYYLFTSFFYNPNKMTTFLKNKQASVVSPAGKSEESYIDRNLEFMVPIAAVYLCAVIFVPNAILGLFFFLHIDSIGLITAVAILMDVTKEMRLRREGNHFGKVAELHDVPMAGFLKSLLEQKGVPCSLRGYYHRALLYFFGPYIEISVLVPEDRVVDAREVVEKYFDPGVLTVPRDSAPSPFPSPTRGEGDNGGKDD